MSGKPSSSKGSGSQRQTPTSSERPVKSDRNPDSIERQTPTSSERPVSTKTQKSVGNEVSLKSDKNPVSIERDKEESHSARELSTKSTIHTEKSVHYGWEITVIPEGRHSDHRKSAHSYGGVYIGPYDKYKEEARRTTANSLESGNEIINIDELVDKRGWCCRNKPLLLLVLISLLIVGVVVVIINVGFFKKKANGPGRDQDQSESTSTDVTVPSTNDDRGQMSTSIPTVFPSRNNQSTNNTDNNNTRSMSWPRQ